MWHRKEHPSQVRGQDPGVFKNGWTIGGEGGDAGIIVREEPGGRRRCGYSGLRGDGTDGAKKARSNVCT